MYLCHLCFKNGCYQFLLFSVHECIYLRKLMSMYVMQLQYFSLILFQIKNMHVGLLENIKKFDQIT